MDVYIFFQSTFFLCVFEKRKKKQITYPCAVLCLSLHQFTQLISLVKSHRSMYVFVDEAAVLFSHNTFVSTVLRSCTICIYVHDLYKLNAIILLNVYACFSFYFLYIALIAFFSTFIAFYFVVCVCS